MWALLRSAAIAALAFSVAGEAGGASQVKISGIYSDLYFNEEGGDLLGTEIMIVPVGSGEWAVFHQHWEGSSRFPVAVPANVKGDRISFKVQHPVEGDEKPEPATQYEGRISAQGFEGTYRHPLTDGTMQSEPIKLKRKKSYWE